MKSIVKICKNKECKREFVATNKRKVYCSGNCCVFATAKRRTKDKDPAHLIWQGMKIKNGCFAKTMTTKDHVCR